MGTQPAHDEPPETADPGSALTMAEFFELSDELNGFLLMYRFGLEEMLTKVNILREELSHADPSGCPIEHVSHRLKHPKSVAEKAERLGCLPSFADVRSKVWDIAGIRIVCSFVTDAYHVLGMLQRQPDIAVVTVKDYIAEPKPSGYKSLHLIVELPVYLSERTEMVRVEVQIRTVAMDFWASLEHKIYYKYRTDVPQRLRDDLVAIAEATDRLDQQMEQLHLESRGFNHPAPRSAPDLSAD